MAETIASRLRIPLAALLGGLLFLSLLGLGVASAYEVAYQGRIYPGVFAEGVELGGLSVGQAEALLRPRLEQVLQQELVLAHGDRAWSFTLEELGLRANVTGLAHRAYQVGRAPDPAANLRQRWQAWWDGVALEAEWTLDEGRTAVVLGRIARGIERPVREGRLSLEGFRIVAVEPEMGRRLDLGASGGAILERVRARSGGTVELAVVEEMPAVRDIARARHSLESMLGGRILLTSQSDDWTPDGVWEEETLTWELGPQELARLIEIRQRKEADGSVSLEPVWRRGTLAEFVAGLAGAIDQEAKEGRFRFDPQLGRAVPVVPSREGRTLQVEVATDALYAALLQGEERLELPVERVRADSSLTGPEAAQIVEVVSEGITQFGGSSRARISNIEVASARYDGLAIQPGAVFSYGQYLGEVTEEEGYVVGLIISGGRTVKGLGGGICQTSTTLFRAAFFGGYPMVERWPHSYRVGYYEPPVGLDATVFTPYVDFKFQNDQETPLLVGTSVDLGRRTLTYTLYGTKPDRRVEMEGPFVSNRVAPPAAEYIEDPTLPQGVLEQVDWAAEGADAVVYRLIYQGQELIAREPYHSHYEAWQARYLVGTGEQTAQN